MIQKMTIKIPKVKPRMHRALFDDDSPFKPKVVKNKNSYERRPKHKNRDWDETND